MVADDARRVNRRHVDDVGCVRIGVMLLRARQGRLQQGVVTHSRHTSMVRDQESLQCQRVVRFNPDRLGHLARTCSVLR